MKYKTNYKNHKALVRSYCNKRKKSKRLSQFQQSTWLSWVTTDWSKKLDKASYKVAKVITKKEILFRIKNFFKEFVLAVVNFFCLFLQWQEEVVFRKCLKIIKLHYQFRTFIYLLSESTDTTNTAHLRIFVRGVFTNFEI